MSLGSVAQGGPSANGHRLVDDAAFERAMAHLLAHDPDGIGRLVTAVGRPARRTREAGFAGLASIIVGQQVSTASAAAIFGRLAAALRPFDPDGLLAMDDMAFRACGLSAGKVRTLRAAATAIVEGRLPLDRLAAYTADEAHAALVAVKGIGPWTADVFLLFCLGHADAWPAGDLALQEAARLLLGLDTRPGTAALSALGERWRPYRGVAATLLWAYYRARTGRQGPGLLNEAAHRP